MNLFENNIIQLYGPAGKNWLQSLPSIISQLTEQWQLTNLRPFTNLSYNYVIHAQRAGTPVVIKIGYDIPTIVHEHSALRVYQGHGCIQLLESNLMYNALLLEHAHPGITLKSLFPLHEEKAIGHVVEIMHQLHSVPLPAATNFPTLTDWVKALYKPYPPGYAYANHIRKAQELAEALLATQTTPVLLHGDLHHGNIVLSQRGWIAIDPKGVIGEPAYEVGSFIRNPWPDLLNQENSTALIEDRINLFAQLHPLDKERIHQWSYVQAVLAAIWELEDGQKDERLAFAQAELLVKNW